MSLKAKILKQAKLALQRKNAFNLFLPQTDLIINHNFKFIFHSYNPQLKYLCDETNKRKTNSLLPPFDEDIHVCDLKEGANHHLLINKYMQCKGHIVLSSIDQTEKQGTKLNISDFIAFEQVFQSFNYNGMLYYNSGLNSGCSQLHKHIQYTPEDEFPILDSMGKNQKLPIYFHVLDIGQISSESMMNGYNELLEMAKNDPSHDSYNFMISGGKAFYVPRRVPVYKCGTVLNSFAISGHFSVWDWSDPIIKKEPLSVLEEVCFTIVK